VLKFGHGAQSAPPQSVSVSAPFLMPSVQAGAWQTLLAEQNPVVQSSPLRQLLPMAQSLHVPPPQSVSVSAPFLTPSLQAGA
jgi:hypothetical protein